ncbi:hypothetical protein D7252_06065 [Microbacterium sp. CGR2]|nr:hypothetical protein D7252_06065 [Microbacterium sp. CGR2]
MASRPTAIVTATALCAALVAVSPTTAWADTENVASEEVVADALAALDDSLLLDATDDSGVGIVALSRGSVKVPADLKEGVSIRAAGQDPLTVALPEADVASAAEVLADGTVTYPAGRSNNSVIVSDVGVQMLTTIVGAGAATSFEYELSLEPGQKLQLVGDGAAVFNADGSTAATVARAWAVDASGASVPTRYEVHGSTLVQRVDHTADDVVYPVVADPIWLAPWVVRCLAGLGLNSSQIAGIGSSGSPGAILAAFGYAAVRCVLGR